MFHRPPLRPAQEFWTQSQQGIIMHVGNNLKPTHFDFFDFLARTSPALTFTINMPGYYSFCAHRQIVDFDVFLKRLFAAARHRCRDNQGVRSTDGCGSS